MSERDRSGLWVSPESIKELRLTLKADKGTLEKYPYTSIIPMVQGNLSRKGTKLAFLGDGKEGTSRQFWGPQELEECTQSYN